MIHIHKPNLLNPLCSLSGYVNQLIHLKSRLHHMEVTIKGGSITPLGDYGDLRQAGPAHEQQNVGMASFPTISRKRVSTSIVITQTFSHWYFTSRLPLHF